MKGEKRIDVKKEKMKIAKKGKGEGRGKERLKKAVIGILLAVIMLGSAFSMMTHLTTGSDVTRTTVRNSYVVNPDNVTISIDGNTSSVLIGQNVQFMYGGNKTGTVTVTGVEGTPAEGYVVTSDSTGWLDTSAMVEGLYNATYENQWELLAVDSPEMALWFKVGETGVSSITQGTPLGIGFTSNLDVNDCVDLKVVTPEGYVLSQNPADPDQKFDDINVSKLLEYGSENKSKRVNTSGWDIGTYTFWVRSEEENARGLDVPTCAITLAVCKADITIETEKNSIVELEKVRLTVAGVPNHNITISSSDPAHTIFPAGYEGNPPYDTSGFNDTIDEDGQRRYVVYFNDTGTYTITVTDATAGLDDDIAITVSEKAVTFSMLSTCIIGRNLTIYGKANTGETIDIAIDDYVMPELNDIITNEFGSFEEGIETDWMAPGSYGIRGFIDRAAGPGDVSGEEDDGATAILMIEEGLTVNLSTDIVPLGDNCDIYGTSSTNYVEIVTITPKGGNGTGRDGLYGVTIDTVPTSNYNFYKRIKVDTGADTGNYTILVLSPGRDSVYGNSPYKYIDNILDLDGAGPEPGVIDVSNKTQHEIVSIVKDVTIDQAGSDDLLWERHLMVYQPKIYVDDDFEDDPANHRWNTIQEGISDANCGDMVYVYAGDYNENVIVNKSITLQGEDRDNTIIDGNGNGDVVNITADNCMIGEFTMQNGNYGIKIFKSSNNNVTGNNVYLNNFDGIDIEWSNNNTITNNTVNSNSIGIHSSHSNNNMISNNTVNLNKKYGIKLTDSSNYNIILGNIASSNNEIGITLSGASNNNVLDSTITNNDYGIYLTEETSNNLIYHNNIINNTNQAYGDGNNTWDNGYPSGGNYWSDHACNGNPSNGSQPYNISGGADAQDHYPFQNLNGWLEHHPVRNLITNGDFSNGLNNWTERGYGIGNRQVEVVYDDAINSSVLEFKRWNSGADGGMEGVYQNLSINVSEYSTLYLEADTKVISNTLSDSGWWSDVYGGDGEFPVHIFLYYEDENGTDWVWTRGFLPVKDYWNRRNYDVVTWNEWYHYVSPNLVNVSTTTTKPHNVPIYSPPPKTITGIFLGGKGWDFRGRIDNARLYGEKGASIPSIIYVPDDYTKIQWAVDNASAGDTIIVRDGTYVENVDVNKRLTVRSENGSALTIVQAANPDDHVFEITTDSVNISGFAITGTAETWGGIYHAGIYLNAVDRCNISNNIISNNTEGIWLYYSNKNTIEKNNASSNYCRERPWIGCGIELKNSNYNQLMSNTANSNYAGILMHLSSNHNTLVNNTVKSNGKHGIEVDYSSFNSITRNNVSLNNHTGVVLHI